MEIAMEHSEMIMAIELMKQENDRLQHLVQCLIVQLGKTGDKFPLREIDRQMELFDRENGT